MSTAQFTVPLIVTVPGQVIASSLWNNEFTNLFTNLNPLGIGAYSDTDSQMQTTTDPFPSGTSRPTSLGGELERIRYIVNLIIGKTYWYQHPSISLETLNTSTPVIPSGTVMPFYQAAAPTGWTQVVTANDKALRVVSGTGGGTGGTNAMSTGLSHSHTVSSHTHDLANHTHTGASHTHSISSDGSHTHNLNTSPAANQAFFSGSSTHRPDTDAQGSHNHGGATGAGGTGTTSTPSSNTSGAATPGTDTQTPTFQYIDVIIASKN